MQRRYEDYGYVDTYQLAESDSKLFLHVERLTILPHEKIIAHIHYTEQVCYTISGQCVNVIDGKTEEISQAGATVHWPAGVTHEMINTADTDFVCLLVICPDVHNNLEKAFDPGEMLENISPQDVHKYLYAAVDALKAQFLDTMYCSYIIFDAVGNVVTSAGRFPAHCAERCSDAIMQGCTNCMKPYAKLPFYSEYISSCPSGMTLFLIPVLLKGTFIGYVEGGFIRTRLTDAAADSGIYLSSPPTIEGVRALLRQIVSSILTFCEFYKFRDDLVARDLQLESGHQQMELLMDDLKNAESLMTDLKINNHFLFNTLNQMASMALDGGIFRLYQAIIDLSRLFRYTLRNSGNTVSLAKEAECLHSYLELQTLRYGDHLILEYSIATALEDWTVPFNILMPIAENAFTHGFASVTDKKLSVAIYPQGGELHIVIRNNGAVLSEEECGAIMEKMRGNSTHGLSMIYHKLQMSYGNAFSITVTSAEETGTAVHLTLPPSGAGRDGPSAQGTLEMR